MAASSFHNLIILIFSLLISTPSSSVVTRIRTPSFRPKALVLPITRDSSTLQYLTTLNQRTPLVPTKLTLDLGGQNLWVDCDQGYTSSTYKPTRCNSAPCKLSNSGACTTQCFSAPRPGCNNNTCSLFPDNTVISKATSGELGQDIVSLHSSNGFNLRRIVSVPNLLFTCGTTFLLEGLANGVKGMAGLGRAKIGLPSLFSSAFRFPRKFAICLPSSTTSKSNSNGVIIFGDGPYTLLPNIDASKSLTYTPLILNPRSTASAHFHGDASSEYFINVKSIKVNEKAVALNRSLLGIDYEGRGGTKISTVDPYTVLETTIYKAVANAFVKEMSAIGIPRVKAISPFGECFDSKKVSSTRVGPAVPSIDLVMENGVYWRMLGGNSMVKVRNDVLCLGFVDEGVKRWSRTTSIVIGGHQLEDNLLQLDLGNKKLGFSSSLLFRQTNCANFNFTFNA